MSDKFKLSAQQWIKGLFMFVVPAIISPLIQMLQNTQEIDLRQVGITAAISALTYISYSFTQDKEGVPFGNAK